MFVLVGTATAVWHSIHHSTNGGWSPVCLFGLRITYWWYHYRWQWHLAVWCKECVQELFQPEEACNVL